MTASIPAALAILGIQPFFGVIGLAAIVLVAATFFGAARWQQPNGKAITIVAGLLLFLLAVFVVVILYLAHSARTGAPM